MYTPTQTLCALSVASQADGADPEWWMHFQIPERELHMYHEATCNVDSSTLKGSKDNPGMNPGKGLFTLKARAKDEHILSFPGYWMQQAAFQKQAEMEVLYAFSVPPGGGWSAMNDLVYVTLPAQATFINSGIVNKEVIPITPCLVYLLVV
jgi:hypothetical protein